MERSIWIYGNPDKSNFGFPLPGDLTRYIRADIFDLEKGRYRYTQGKNADVIVLSREGLAYGHLDVEEKVKPTQQDREAYPKVKHVYLIRKSTLYTSPVALSNLGISGIRFGRRLTEAEFDELQVLAGGTQEFHSYRSLPESVAGLEWVLKEVRRRLGQSEFRKKLLTAYNSRCAVTGCDAVEALEAAHITPVSEAQSNETSNGLLLRADIHTLFDLNLIGFEPDHLTVSLSPGLQRTKYSELVGKRVTLPTNAADHPKSNALAQRWKKFLAQ